MIWSEYPHVVSQFREYQPSIPAALLTGGEHWRNISEFFREALWRNAQACSIHFEALTPEIALEARNHGLGPYTWTVNDRSKMRYALDCGVAGITTDYPDRLNALLDEMDGSPGAN